MIEFLIMSHFTFVLLLGIRHVFADLLPVQFILGNVGSKRQIQTLEQIIKLSERFLTEVAELQEVGLVVLYQVAQGLHVCCLQAVEGTNGEVHVDELPSGS